MCSFRYPLGKNQSELHLATEEAMQSLLVIQSTFLDMLRSTIAGHLPHSMLELHRAETITQLTASQLEEHLQAALVVEEPRYSATASHNS
jgi:hypothetical protein